MLFPSCERDTLTGVSTLEHAFLQFLRFLNSTLSVTGLGVLETHTGTPRWSGDGKRRPGKQPCPHGGARGRPECGGWVCASFRGGDRSGPLWPPVQLAVNTIAGLSPGPQTHAPQMCPRGHSAHGFSRLLQETDSTGRRNMPSGGLSVPPRVTFQVFCQLEKTRTWVQPCLSRAVTAEDEQIPLRPRRVQRNVSFTQQWSRLRAVPWLLTLPCVL